jgi:hypothetical protein
LKNSVCWSAVMSRASFVLRSAHCALRCASSRAHPCWQGRAPGLAHTGAGAGGQRAAQRFGAVRLRGAPERFDGVQDLRGNQR